MENQDIQKRIDIVEVITFNQENNTSVSKFHPTEVEYFECACHNLEHLFVMNYDSDYGDMWIDIHLSSFPWYKRVWFAIKYVFGFKSKYGCFSTWQMNDKDVERMQIFLKKNQLTLEKLQETKPAPENTVDNK